MHERAIHFQSKCRSTLQLIEDISRSDTNAAYLACALYATLVAVAAKPDQIMKINITLQIYTTPTTPNALVPIRNLPTLFVDPTLLQQ